MPPKARDMGDWIPPSTFVNRSAQVDTLNKLIKELTEGAGLAYPALHMYGIKYFKSGTRQHKFDSKNGSARIWRETEVNPIGPATPPLAGFLKT